MSSSDTIIKIEDLVLIIEDEKDKTSSIISSHKYFVDFKYTESRKFNEKLLKALDEINEDLAHAIFEEGLFVGKSYEEVLDYVKNM